MSNLQIPAAEMPAGFPEDNNSIISRVIKNSIRFFGRWANNHATDDLGGAGLLIGEPAQAIDKCKSPAVMPGDILADEPLLPYIGAKAGDTLTEEHLLKAVELTVRASFEDQEQATRFLNSLDKPYPYAEDANETYLDVIEGDYLSQGKSIVVLMPHAGEGLNDVPQVTGLFRLALGKKFGAKYLDKVGEIVSKTLTYETYKGIGVPAILKWLGNTIWVSPQTKSADNIRQEIGMSEKEFEEMSEYINLGGGHALASDTRTKYPDANGQIEAGHIYVASPAGTRAGAKKADNGEVETIEIDSITVNTAGILGFATAMLPAAVVDGEVRFGPIIDLAEKEPIPEGLSREERKAFRDQAKKTRLKELLQRLDDGMEIAAGLIDVIVGKDGVACYKRTTSRGEAYDRFSGKNKVVTKLGSSATMASFST